MLRCLICLLLCSAGLLEMAAAASGQILDRLGGGGLGLGQEPVVTVEGQFTLPTAEDPARLFITATMAPDWHIYSITQAPGGPNSTKIHLDTSTAYQKLGDFQPLSPPDRKREGIWSDPNLVTETHQGSVTWYIPIKLAPSVDPTLLRITGRVNAQACSTSCLPSQDYPFAAVLGQGMPIPAEGDAVARTYPPVDVGKLLVQLVFAFVGGLILNLMPCVLPVISLKLLAFLEQAGESRTRVLALNLSYTLGLLSVFMVLAFLVASAGDAWGQHFTLPWFKVTMIGLVFAMALSLLGVWEITIPGFVGRGDIGKLQAKEGPGGAFFKGVFATILATPCSAPLLGPVFGYLLKQPPGVAYLVFATVGLGMASPYLVVGVFPSLIRFLPKPGAWMETFKQLMGFLLLATAVYLISAVSEKYLIPTLTLLVGLWFGCWWIGRTPPTAPANDRLTAWAGGILVPALVGMIAFTALVWEPIIPWQPFSPEALAKARAEGKTVMVDFTADWCPNCKWNSRMAIEKEEVLALVERNEVVPLLADWTDPSEAIKNTLNELGANSIPLLAIWPPGGEPVVMRDLVTKTQVINALSAAGPSRPQAGSGQRAMMPGPR